MKGVIKLCYTKIISTESGSAWDKRVFEDSYKEFFMQAQQFDQQNKYATFQEILKNNPKADSMHYLVSTSVKGHLMQLNKVIPEVLNVSGKLCLPFQQFRFEIIDSHRSDKNLHKVAIHFYSDPLLWIDSFENYLVFGLANQLDALNQGKEIETDTLVFRLGLTVSSFKKI